MLSARWMGPFNTYRLADPAAWRAFNEFNVERLRRYLRRPLELGGDADEPPPVVAQAELEDSSNLVLQGTVLRDHRGWFVSVTSIQSMWDEFKTIDFQIHFRISYAIELQQKNFINLDIALKIIKSVYKHIAHSIAYMSSLV